MTREQAPSAIPMQLNYLAGPLFNEAERAFNATLTTDIESLGYKVFLPERDGAESDRSPYDAMGRQERRFARFSLDRDQILICDIFYSFWMAASQMKVRLLNSESLMQINISTKRRGC
jgi:hypothetical protein